VNIGIAIVEGGNRTAQEGGSTGCMARYGMEGLNHQTKSFRGREKMLEHLKVMMQNEEGQALAEYGLILALIAVICIAALTLLGGNVSAMLAALAAAINP